MILADKIINERKKNGWSQEELADKLGVSRQSVSKWEGAQSVPDIQKIIQMAGIFGVSTDYLLKDEIETTELTAITHDDISDDYVKVTMEEANEYIELEKKYSPWVANGVSLCITSPVILILLAGVSEYTGKMSENLAAGIGVITLFVMIICAVCLFMKSGKQLDKFEFLKEKNIDTEYGVTGMVKERQKAFEHTSELLTIGGVVMCIGCSIPLLIAAFADANDMVVIYMVCVLLVIIAIAVNMFVRAGSINDAYRKLLQEGDFTVDRKNENKRIAPWVSIYWMLTLTGYLAWSFISGAWDITWIVWPVAGVLFAVYRQILLMTVGARK